MIAELRQRIDEYAPHELLLAAMIAGVARVSNYRAHLTSAELFVGKAAPFKHFDLPVDLAFFPIMAEFPVAAVTALHNAIQNELSR